MRHTFAVPITAAVLIASLLAGCGGDDSSDSGTTTATTGASGDAAVCAAYAQVQADAKSIKQLDPANVTATQVKQKLGSLKTSVQVLGSAASETKGQAQSDVKSAVNSFESQLNSAEGQPVSQQLVTLGTAISGLQSSLSQTASDLKCK